MISTAWLLIVWKCVWCMNTLIRLMITIHQLVSSPSSPVSASSTASSCLITTVSEESVPPKALQSFSHNFTNNCHASLSHSHSHYSIMYPRSSKNIVVGNVLNYFIALSHNCCIIRVSLMPAKYWWRVSAVVCSCWCMYLDWVMMVMSEECETSWAGPVISSTPTHDHHSPATWDTLPGYTALKASAQHEEVVWRQDIGKIISSWYNYISLEAIA